MKLRALSLLAGAALLAGCATVPDPDTPAHSGDGTAPAPTTATGTPQETEPEPSAEPQSFSLALTGDVLLHPRLLREANTGGQKYDFSPLLAGLEPYIQDADAALCNLETPIGAPPYSGYPMFTVPAQIVTDLKQVGYDGCTTATNHTVDAGTAGVKRTIDTLEQAGMFSTGSYRTAAEAEAPPIMEVDGVKLGVIAGTYSLNGMSADTDWRVDTDISAASLIQRAKDAREAGAQVVVAAVHDGAEYTNRPTAEQRKLGRALAASGAFDFIYMHHTHSVLPIEKHKGTWIVYGLGNSVAKHATPTVLNREGISVKATFTRQQDDDWSVSELAWVPHFLTEDPVRWCQVAEASRCVEDGQAEASRERSTKTVDAYGAFKDGLVPWEPAGTR